MSVRPLMPDDLEEVRRIDGLHAPADQFVDWGPIVTRFLCELDGPDRIGLAVDGGDGKLSGFLFGEVRALEFGSEPCGWIFAVGVDPHSLRAGVGTALIGEACRRFSDAGVRLVRTMVLRNDVPMLSFFRSSGFVGGPYVQLELDPQSGPAPTAQRDER